MPKVMSSAALKAKKARLQEEMKLTEAMERKARRAEDTKKKVLWGVGNLALVKQKPEYGVSQAKKLVELNIYSTKDLEFMAMSFNEEDGLAEIGEIFFKAWKEREEKEKGEKLVERKE